MFTRNALIAVSMVTAMVVAVAAIVVRRQAPPPQASYQATVLQGWTCIRTDLAGSRCQQTAEDPADCLPGFDRKLADAQDQSAAVKALANRGTYLLHNGMDDAAVANFQEAVTKSVELGQIRHGMALRQLGIAQLRRAETRNCATGHLADACVYPLQGGGIHQDASPARDAVTSLDRALELIGPDGQIQWLLNVAAMAAGGYPVSVPPKWLLPITAVVPGAHFRHFANIAPSLGLIADGLVGSALMEDVDGDGWLDLVMTSSGPCDPIRLYRNTESGLVAANDPELARQTGVANLIQADFDNDGDRDIYLMRGVWESTTTADTIYHQAQHHTLLANDGRGRFSDVTRKMGLRTSINNGVAADWGDYNNDGWLDLVVCNEHREIELFRNENGKSFSNVAEAAGLRTVKRCLASLWGDIDNDGWLDLFLAGFSGPNRLYLNRGDGTFVEQTPATLAEHPGRAFTSWFWDVNNDGWLDLMVGDYNSSSRPSGVPFAGAKSTCDRPRVYVNDGTGNLVDQTEKYALHGACFPMGGNFGDLDNDGFQDVLIGTGAPPFEMLMPNRAFQNRTGRGFIDITYRGGFGHLQKGHGIAFGDLDLDGDQDVAASFGGWIPADRFADSLYANPGGQENWVILRLAGSKSNRDAMDSRVQLETEGPSGARSIHRRVGSGGSFGSNSLQLEIGLGDSTRISQLLVYWHGSGSISTFEGLEPNRIYAVSENKAAATEINVQPRLWTTKAPGEPSGSDHERSGHQ